LFSFKFLFLSISQMLLHYF